MMTHLSKRKPARTGPQLAAVIAIMLTGCSNFASPPKHYYVLGAAQSPTVGTTSEIGRPVVQLVSVIIPDYLDNQDILVRGSGNDVTPSSNGRWAERLSVGSTRALSAALAVRLPAYAVVAASPPAGPPPTKVDVTVTIFEARTDGHAYLAAQWTVSDNAGKISASESTSLVEKLAEPGDAGIAAAMSRLIERLADATTASISATRTN